MSDIKFTPTAPVLHQRMLRAAESQASTNKAAAKKAAEIRSLGVEKGWNN